MSVGWIASTNPYDGEIWTEVPQGTAKDVDEAVSKGPWSTINPTQRGKLLFCLAEMAPALAAGNTVVIKPLTHN